MKSDDDVAETRDVASLHPGYALAMLQTYSPDVAPLHPGCEAAQ
jgi:hypothetical protein